MMEFQRRLRNQMNGILSDMYPPPPQINGRIHGSAGCAAQLPSMIDSPPPLHNLSLNPSSYPQSYYPWEYCQQCGYLQ